MKANTTTRNIVLCTALIMIAAFSRIFNAEFHWYNFAPLVAISLFSGSILKNKSYSYILPLAAYFISDLYIQLVHGNGFYGISQFFVYGGMALVVLLGAMMKKVSVLRVMGFTIGGSLLFWVVSNFGVFLGGYWGTGIAGLTKTYLMALPFYSKDGVATNLFFNSIAGDLIFSGILFGAYFALKNRTRAQNKAIA